MTGPWTAWADPVAAAALETLVRPTVLLAGALGIARLLGGAPASARHTFWTVIIAAVLVLPWLPAALPRLAVPVPVPGWVGTGAGADGEGSFRLGEGRGPVAEGWQPTGEDRGNPGVQGRSLGVGVGAAEGAKTGSARSGANIAPGPTTASQAPGGGPPPGARGAPAQ